MGAPVYSASDYAQAMANLLPRGAAWPRDYGSNLMALMRALAPTYQRSGAAAAALIPDVSPASTVNFITEWEETLGLPDPCTASNPTTAQRQAAILAKFIGSGGQTIPYYQSVAAALGYTVTVQEMQGFILGVSHFNDPLGGPGWDYVWQVTTVSTTAGAVTSAEFQCRIRAIAPAQTLVIFA